IDWCLVGANLLLAFFLASFVARNADIWMHLAVGRALVQGTYQFGVDPFSSTMQGAYWVNHSWLFDLATYGLHQFFGGFALVVGKALVIVALAAILIRLGSQNGSIWVAVVVTAVALVAGSARFALHSVCVSYLLLALTLW